MSLRLQVSINPHARSVSIELHNSGLDLVCPDVCTYKEAQLKDSCALCTVWCGWRSLCPALLFCLFCRSYAATFYLPCTVGYSAMSY
eukprot:jgi/Chrzof1/5091/Cz15g11040.t1